MNPLENYLKELLEIRSTGAAVKETSLAALLNEIGKTLKPKVKRIIKLRDLGEFGLSSIGIPPVPGP